VTKKDLLADAKALGLEVDSKMTVSDLETVIAEAQTSESSPDRASEGFDCPVCTRTYPHEHE
jgi:hypothetical protein